MGPDPADVSALLIALGSEEHAAEARERLWPLVYEELHQRAVRAMARERANHTLQPTALVHEAYLRLIRASGPAWEGRAHFLAIAARIMRQVLVDHARKHNALRRGGDLLKVTLDEPQSGGEGRVFDALALHLALERLEQHDPRTAQVAEMRLFGGATRIEIGEALGVSPRTVDNEWATARMWLHRELTTDAS